MKKLFLAFSFLLLGSLANAQTGSYTVQWNPNPPAELVATYTVTWTAQGSGAQYQQTVTVANNCTAVACAVIFTGIPAAIWQVSVYATNDGGNGLPTTITYSTVPTTPPSAPTGVRVNKVVQAAATSPTPKLAAPSAPKVK